MAANLIEGSALGPAFDQLFQTVLGASERVSGFSSTLNSLRSTLVSIKPFFDDMEELNKTLNRPQQETDAFIDRLREGEKLIRKCLQIRGWDLYRKYTYSKRLSELEGSLLRFSQMNMQAHMARDTKGILVGVNDINRKVDKALSILKNTA